MHRIVSFMIDFPTTPVGKLVILALIIFVVMRIAGAP